MKHISVLGSTGSIGTQTLEVVRNNGDIRIDAIAAAGNNIVELERQVREFKPRLVCIYNDNRLKDLECRIADTGTKVVSGSEGLIQAATLEKTDTVVTAVVGMIGIAPTLAAIDCGKDIALANKETLVAAGHIIMPRASSKGVGIYPVDSEHSAIFQALNGENANRIERILLTASGGPFRGKTREEMKNVTVEEALRHPNWSMGKKITIDSSTMVNKGLEVIEARWLFNVDFDNIEVVVQPQSLIHSMVEFVDGGIMAQLGMPDMRHPIQYALYYPDRRPMAGKRVDFNTLRGITFEKPDFDNFKGLSLAYRAGRTGGSMPAVFNAADEKAVSLFLSGKIGFNDITDLIEMVMDEHEVTDNPTLEEILGVESRVNEKINGFLERKRSRNGGLA